jgi:class 3 adenylate cyclase
LDSLIWPQVRYADAEGVSIAYEVRGDGPIDVVRVPGLLGSLFAGVVDPQTGEVAAWMSSFSRLVTIDRRGAGCSDPLVLGQAPPLEQQATDIRAVMDAVGSRRAALVATADGGPPAILFAATFPDRVRALVLRNSWARPFRSEDYPIGRPVEDLPELAKQLHDQWGDRDNPWGYHAFGLDRRNEPGFREVFARLQHLSASRAAATAAMLNMDVDVRDLLPLVQAPTLVLHGAVTRDDRRRHSHFLVEHIPNAQLGTYVGADAFTPRFTPEDYSMIEEFLTGARPPVKTDRVLASVLFTDIVGSTERAAALGDHHWRQQLDAHDAMIRRCLNSFSGREVNTTGDGFLAVFDGPARAIRCAQTIVDHARQLGIDVRAGVHTGECETRGKDLSGIAVHIGSRVAARAGAGEVYATRTVKDLVAGSGIVFADRGLHHLKGVPEPWQLFRAT